MLRPAKTADDETMDVFLARARGEDVETRAIRMADVVPLVRSVKPDAEAR